MRLVLEEGRTLKSVNEEYNLGEGTVRGWIRKFEEETPTEMTPKECAALVTAEQNTAATEQGISLKIRKKK